MPLPPQPDWTPSRFAIEHDVAVDPDDRAPVSVVVRHPTAPFFWYLDASVLDSPDEAEGQLQKATLQYLLRVPKKIPGLLDPTTQKVFDQWLDALRPKDAPVRRFGWLPLVRPDAKFGHPMASYWFTRDDERTLVILASERLGSGEPPKPEDFLASGFGLRVVGHLRKVESDDPYVEFRVCGFSASLPFGAYRTSGVIALSADTPASKELGAFIANEAESIGRTLHIYKPVFTGLRLHEGPSRTLRFEARGTAFDYAADGVSSGSLPYTFYVRGATTKDGTVSDLSSLERVPLVAYATRAFLKDPASQGGPSSARERRPTRSGPTRKDERLGNYLSTIPALPASPFRVTTAKPVRPPRPKSGPPNPVPSLVRSNLVGEVNAKVNLGRFRDRLHRYGIHENTYFRVGRPDVAECRSPIRPGPGKDGNVVNARVSLGPWKKSFYDPTGSDDRPAIKMHFGVADLSTRSRCHRKNDDWVPAESLGITADPRWFWHELGHVLLAASVGELEFRFAHSAGDALAAIASDPQSRLAGDATARGATFPWVFVPRRHDRCAGHGWSWSGTMHRPPRMSAHPERVQLKGYWSEQILSSSLFRLYLSLGGEAMAADGRSVDIAARQAASDYALYLIIKAIGLLGYAGAVPAHRPDHFVSALISADIGTERFSTSDARVGGCAHKIIRWAFETQGLYVPDNGFRNGPGDPPRVDVYIADERLDREGKGYGPGSYAPISLHWKRDQSKRPEWHAALGAIAVEGDQAFITVNNRGNEKATAVTVDLWAHKCRGSAVPNWDRDKWTACTTSRRAQDIAKGRPVRFGPYKIPASVPRPLVLLASATCDDDRANIDPRTLLPCARLPVSLTHLVASDNNLGVRYVP